MKLKEKIYEIIIISLLLISVSTWFEGIVLPPSALYYISFLIFSAIFLMLSDPILHFLTIPKNFGTSFASRSILLFLALFLAEQLIPGVYFNSYIISHKNIIFMTISDIQFAKEAVIAIYGIIVSLFVGIIENL